MARTPAGADVRQSHAQSGVSIGCSQTVSDPELSPNQMAWEAVGPGARGGPASAQLIQTLDRKSTHASC